MAEVIKNWKLPKLILLNKQIWRRTGKKGKRNPAGEPRGRRKGRVSLPTFRRKSNPRTEQKMERGRSAGRRSKWKRIAGKERRNRLRSPRRLRESLRVNFAGKISKETATTWSIGGRTRGKSPSSAEFA